MVGKKFLQGVIQLLLLLVLCTGVSYATVDSRLNFDLYLPGEVKQEFKVNDFVPVWFELYHPQCSECTHFGIFISTDNKLTWQELINNMRMPLSSICEQSVVNNVYRCKYNVPATPSIFAKDTTTAYIKLVLYDSSNKVVAQGITRKPFSVKHVKLKRPDVKTTFLKGYQEKITWVYYNPAKSVKEIRLSYTTSPNSDWQLIKVLPGTASEYFWTVPPVSTTTGYIKVELFDFDNNIIATDTNNEPFTIN